MLKKDKPKKHIDYQLVIFATLLISVLFCSASPSSAQSNRVDSLENLVAESTDPDVQLRALQFLFRNEYIKGSSAERLKVIPQLDSLAKKATKKNLIFDVGVDVAGAYISNEYASKARLRLEKVLTDVEGVTDTRAICFAHSMLGMIYSGIDIEKAIESYSKSIEVAKASNDSAVIGAMLVNAAGVYVDSGDEIKAKEMYLDAIGYLEPTGIKVLLGNAFNNLALVESDSELAKSYLLKAQKFYTDIGYLSDANYTNFVLGRLYYENGQPRKAVNAINKYFSYKADSLSFRVNNSVLIYLGLSYLDLNKIDSARMFLESSWTYHQEKEPFQNEALSFLHHGLEGLHVHDENFERAYYHAKEQMIYQDSLDLASGVKYSQEFFAKYENEKKEKLLTKQQLTIEKEKNKRNQQTFLGLGIFFFGLALAAWYFMQARRRRQNTEHMLTLQKVEANSLKELNQMKSRWFENISHDIRTPLTLISAPIKDVLGFTKSASAQNLLQIADRNSQHLLQLTNEMLELARLENNVIPLQEQSKMTRLEIFKIIHAFDSYASEQNVRIGDQVDLNEDLILKFDYDKYEKIFNNLFKNAIQYSPEETEIAVQVSFSADKLITQIKDQGAGIPQNEIPLLFDKYFRASHQQSKQIEGSGLGLSIVKELIELMNGTIHVESEMGIGTVFTYSIPVTVDAQFVESGVSDTVDVVPELVSVDHQTARLLLVEDNAEMLLYLTTVLSSSYKVTTASNALAALQILDSQSFDLILSDIMMPGMDGFTFKKRVNTMTNHQNTAFIFLSAKSLDDDKMIGLKLGVDDYITKPFVTAELNVRIKNLLNRKSIRESEQILESSEDETQTISPSETFIDDASKYVLSQMQNPNFGVEDLANHVLLSKRQLSRQVKKLTGLTTVQFILEVRLQQARKLLLSNEVYSAKEVQHRIGIQSQSYFSKKYSERFGVRPGTL